VGLLRHDYNPDRPGQNNQSKRARGLANVKHVSWNPKKRTPDTSIKWVFFACRNTVGVRRVNMMEIVHMYVCMKK
jgi:hypothetical protein